jgi:hypothetical protein
MSYYVHYGHSYVDTEEAERMTIDRSEVVGCFARRKS